VATIVQTGTLSAVGNGPAFGPVEAGGIFAVTVEITGTATARIERSFDGGTTWVNRPRDKVGGSISSQTATFFSLLDEPEAGILYRVAVTAWTSGAVNWRFAQ
jgi:hypothetical protein